MPMMFDLAPFLTENFVETGTSKGEGVQKALEAGFSKVWSVEIVTELHEAAKERFASAIRDGRLELRLGDSFDWMPKIVAQLKGSATFWLDAHTSRVNVRKDEVGIANCPVYRELEVIRDSGRSNDVIMIDDIRLIVDPNAWRGHDVSVDGMMDRLHQINPDYVLSLEQGYTPADVLVARPASRPGDETSGDVLMALSCLVKDLDRMQALAEDGLRRNGLDPNSLRTGFPAYHRWRSLALRGQGRFDEAYRSMRHALALQPDNVDWRRELVELCREAGYFWRGIWHYVEFRVLRARERAA